MARKRKAIVPMKYPHGHEYAYRRILLTLTLQHKRLLKQYMSPKVPEMVAEVTEVHLPTGQIRQDAGWHTTLRDIINKITQEMMQPTNKAIDQAITQIAPGVNRYNKAEWQKLIRHQYGVDPTKERPDQYDALLKNWSVNNALLIKDIPFKAMNQIADLTTQTLMSGKAPGDMERDVYNIMSDRMDVTDSRAKLIARDQVSKLNGNLTEERQTDIGVDSYVWRTVGDERVRDTHEENDGQTFAWADPPVETGHPGEDYQCRCWAEPVLPEVVQFEASLGEAEMEDA